MKPLKPSFPVGWMRSESGTFWVRLKRMKPTETSVWSLLVGVSSHAASEKYPCLESIVKGCFKWSGSMVMGCDMQCKSACRSECL